MMQIVDETCGPDGVDATCAALGVCRARYYRSRQPRAYGPRYQMRCPRALLPEEQRTARFHSTIVLLRHADDPQPLIAEGEWHGEIGFEERGEGGFGYDPMFWLPQFGKMAAELSHEQKAQISHRAKALQILLQRLKITP